MLSGEYRRNAFDAMQNDDNADARWQAIFDMVADGSTPEDACHALLAAAITYIY